MCNRNRVAALFAGAVILAMPAMSVAGTVAYFYNQTNSAAPVSVTIKGKTTLMVKAVAPGHISAAIVLPNGYPNPMYAAPAAQKMLKDMGRSIPTLVDVSFHSPGGRIKVEPSLHTDILDAAHVRTLIYFMRVNTPGAAPEPEDVAAVAVRDWNYQRVAEGRAMVAIVNEIHAKGLKLASGRFDVWFRMPNGDVGDEPSNSGFSLVSPDMLKPGHYDLLALTPAPSGLVNLQAAKTAKPIGSLTAADLKPGRISVYLIRTPGKLEHVIDLPPQ